MNDIVANVGQRPEQNSGSERRFSLLKSIFIHCGHHLPIVGSARGLLVNMKRYLFRSELFTALEGNSTLANYGEKWTMCQILLSAGCQPYLPSSSSYSSQCCFCSMREGVAERANEWSRFFSSPKMRRFFSLTTTADAITILARNSLNETRSIGA